MPEPKVFDKYPAGTVFIVVLATLLVYIASIYLMFQLGFAWGILFIIYILALEFSICYQGCACCCYYGKLCAFGRGKIAPLIVKRSDPQKFCERKVTWKNLLPHILVTLIPVIAGIVLLVQNFTWLILILTLIPVFSWFAGNPLIFGKLACPHCKQGRICCPANNFFGKKKKDD